MIYLCGNHCCYYYYYYYLHCVCLFVFVPVIVCLCRWSELTRKLELWIEIHELSEQGEYVPVDVSPRPEVPSGGVFQLRQVTPCDSCTVVLTIVVHDFSFVDTT